MKICQYEFLFESEFVIKIDTKLSKLLNISMDNIIRKDINGEMFALRKATENNYMLFVAHESSLLYLVIIRCNATYENEIQKFLFGICEEMEDCYDQDHRGEVVNVFGNEKTYLKNLEEIYQVSSLFGICVD